MKEITIKSRWNDKVIVCGKYKSIKECVVSNRGKMGDAYLSGANLRSANLSDAYLSGANLSDADLSDADLSDAYLSGADLSDAYLSDANLSGADLSGADLSGADLRSADLSGANLSGADLLMSVCNLYSLKLLPKSTKLRYWKYLTNGKSPYQGFAYKVGEVYTFDEYSEDEKKLCAEGGNVATLQWCLQDGYIADEFIEVEFQVKDIAAIPYYSDGKFRVKRFKVLRKLNRDEAIKFFMGKLNEDSTDENPSS